MSKGPSCVEKEFHFKQKLESCCNDLVQDVYLGEEFDRLLEEVREVKPDIQVVGYLKSDVKDPLSVVKTFISNNQDHWLQLCQPFDSQGVLKITRADFVKCLKVG